MSLASFSLILALLTIPWTIAGLIHPPAAGLRNASRMKVFGIGMFALVILSAVTDGLTEPQSAGGSKTSDAEAFMAAMWLLTCIAWPFAALVMRVKGRSKAVAAKVVAAPVTNPWEGDKPQPLSAEQRKALDLQEREPSEAVRLASAQPQPQPTTQAATITTTAEDDRFANLCPELVATRTVTFLYENAQGEISDRKVDVDQVGTSHFAGFCQRELAQRTFRFDRILGMATLADSGKMVLPEQLRDLLRGYDEQELRRRKRVAAKTCSEILFTGFKKDRRAELEAIATAAGMVVRKNVTTNLDFLCAGSNAGPTKLAEALERGVIALDEQQFLRMLETGEVPA